MGQKMPTSFPVTSTTVVLRIVSLKRVKTLALYFGWSGRRGKLYDAMSRRLPGWFFEFVHQVKSLLKRPVKAGEGKKSAVAQLVPLFRPPHLINALYAISLQFLVLSWWVQHNLTATGDFGHSRGIRTNRAVASLSSPGEALTVTTPSCLQRKESADERTNTIGNEILTRLAKARFVLMPRLRSHTFKTCIFNLVFQLGTLLEKKLEI